MLDVYEPLYRCKSRVRGSRPLGSVGAKPNGLATRPVPRISTDRLDARLLWFSFSTLNLECRC